MKDETKSIVICMELSLKEIQNIIAEYETNQSSFVHVFFEDVLRRIAKTTKQMKENSETVMKINPIFEN